MSERLCFCCIAIVLLVPTPGKSAERIKRAISIYTNVPAGGEPDSRGEEELLYSPFYYAPSGKSRDIDVDPAAKDPSGKPGTCVQITMNFNGPNEFAIVGFTPDGAARLGQLPGADILTKLGPGPNDKVYLELKARRRVDDNAVVSFRVGGLAGNPHKDSLRPPASRTPDLDSLSADWVTYRVDCSDYVAMLNSVLCPLQVVVETSRNPKARPAIVDSKTGKTSNYVQVVFFLDEIRFICVSGDKE